jgi:succinate dehydrogenase/fumarate reductase flavoprotein subunit
MTAEVFDGTPAEGTLEGTDSFGTQDQTASPEVDQVALARKRQAGAEAARQEAARQLKEAKERLAKYEAAERSEDQQKAADIATLQERLAAAEAKAAQAEEKAAARILDVKYPNARKELPEVTDEVRLAKFETLLSDDDYTPPPVQKPNEQNRAVAGTPQSRPEAEETFDDMVARFKASPLPEEWGA